MSLELVNNLLELAQKNMSEGDYLEAANLLKEKYKIIDEVDNETMIFESPIEFFTTDEHLFTVKGFKYRKCLKDHLDYKNLIGHYILQIQEQEYYIKDSDIFHFIDTIIENQLLQNLIIKNSFYGVHKIFFVNKYLRHYINLQRDRDDDDDDYDDDLDRCKIFDIYVKTQFTNICKNTIKQTIIRFFNKM
jgi:hypothetical protein